MRSIYCKPTVFCILIFFNITAFTITNFIWGYCEYQRPVCIYTDVLKHVKQTEDQLKPLNFNCRSLLRKRADQKILLRDFGLNTTIGLTETWNYSENDSKLWEIDSEKLFSFICDRNLSEITKKAVVSCHLCLNFWTQESKTIWRWTPASKISS